MAKVGYWCKLMFRFLRIAVLMLMLSGVSLSAARALGYASLPMSSAYHVLMTQLRADNGVMCWFEICPGRTIYYQAKRLSNPYPMIFSDNFGYEFQYSDQISIQISNDGGTD